MKMGYKTLSLIQMAFVGVVAFLTLALGIYHFTHHGRVSGGLGLTSVVLLMLVLFLPYSPKRTYNRLSVIQITFIGIVDFLALIFGIYHLTTPDGLPSGILELTAFTLLTLVFFLPSRSPAS